MLRRKAKRELESSDHDEGAEAVAKKHGRRTTESREDVDDLENLVFGYQQHLDNDIQVRHNLCCLKQRLTLLACSIICLLKVRSLTG